MRLKDFIIHTADIDIFVVENVANYCEYKKDYYSAIEV